MPWWIVENTLIAAWLALLVALVSRAKRVPPVVRHGLWLVVLIKLIVPPVFSLGITVPGNWERTIFRTYRQVRVAFCGCDSAKRAAFDAPGDHHFGSVIVPRSPGIHAMREDALP